MDTLTKPSAKFPFESKFVTIDGYKIHYVEERGEGTHSFYTRESHLVILVEKYIAHSC